MDSILINKRANDEIKADRPTLNEVKFIPKIPIYFFLENIVYFFEKPLIF